MCVLWLLSRGIKHENKTILINKREFNALVSDTPRKMTIGLMFRSGIKRNECMLFVFPGFGSHPIWMHNMKFAIDVIWLDEKKRVVHIQESMKPSRWYELASYESKVPSKYVIELASGSSSKLKIKLGTQVRW